MQLEPEGASHPCEPGWMSVWASTPTGRPMTSHVDGLEA